MVCVNTDNLLHGARGFTRTPVLVVMNPAETGGGVVVVVGGCVEVGGCVVVVVEGVVLGVDVGVVLVGKIIPPPEVVFFGCCGPQ